MFFSRRRWASRIVERMPLPAQSKEAAALIDLAIAQAKQDERNASAAARKVAKQVTLAFAAMALADNEDAIGRLAGALAVPREKAQDLLQRFARAARELAVDSGWVARRAD
jgi:hypothetical protein